MTSPNSGVNSEMQRRPPWFHVGSRTIDFGLGSSVGSEELRRDHVLGLPHVVAGGPEVHADQSCRVRVDGENGVVGPMPVGGELAVLGRSSFRNRPAGVIPSRFSTVISSPIRGDRPSTSLVQADRSDVLSCGSLDSPGRELSRPPNWGQGRPALCSRTQSLRHPPSANGQVEVRRTPQSHYRSCLAR